MNGTLETQVSLPPQEAEQHPTQHTHRALPSRRVGLLDRTALHLGIALIKWGRRPGNLPEHERRANRLERALASRRREQRLAAHRDAVLLSRDLIGRIG
ncbi:hypothetical protein BH11ACT3_BH11ACT3_02840 [soil metagenome]